MEQIIAGKAYVLGDDIDTDQIIPAEHLVYSLSDPEEKKNYGKFALSGVPKNDAGLPEGNQLFVREGKFESEYTIIIGGKNFGCGSSREHAPACLKIAGIKAVVAKSYARIFYRNSVDGGFFIPFESSDKLLKNIHTGDNLTIDVSTGILTNNSSTKNTQTTTTGRGCRDCQSGKYF